MENADRIQPGESRFFLGGLLTAENNGRFRRNSADILADHGKSFFSECDHDIIFSRAEFWQNRGKFTLDRIRSLRLVERIDFQVGQKIRDTRMTQDVKVARNLLVILRKRQVEWRDQKNFFYIGRGVRRMGKQREEEKKEKCKREKNPPYPGSTSSSHKTFPSRRTIQKLCLFVTMS
ncbi:hypothetical protein SDC9_183391 [bioreactor metagenome]|uniref:Uncharacterized protein n=1 Tax=bioreactor metagenome TaxID=1076179 RepID=A0A645HCN7_9ZZZZ